MKKHHGHQGNERKKRTRAEITELNKKRELKREAKQMQMSAQEPKWEDLNGLHNACLQLLGTASPVSQLFVNKELLNAMGDNVVKLRDLASSLNKDIKEYADALVEIRKTHEGRAGNVTDPDELMLMFSIGENYQRWTESYQQVVIPTIQDITALANSFLPSDKHIVQQGA